MGEVTNPFLKFPLAHNFRWKTSPRNGPELLLEPRKMVTRHLFYTLRMIWNHTMPKEAFVGSNAVRYSHLNSFYSREYLREAVRQIGRELATRKDITNEWLEELRFMWDYLHGNPNSLEHQPVLEDHT